MTITANFERFQYFNFEKKFLKNENLIHETGVPVFIESNKIENAILLHKTVISEANVKTNRMGSTK